MRVSYTLLRVATRECLSRLAGFELVTDVRLCPSALQKQNNDSKQVPVCSCCKGGESERSPSSRLARSPPTLKTAIQCSILGRASLPFERDIRVIGSEIRHGERLALLGQITGLSPRSQCNTPNTYILPRGDVHNPFYSLMHYSRMSWYEISVLHSRHRVHP